MISTAQRKVHVILWNYVKCIMSSIKNRDFTGKDFAHTGKRRVWLSLWNVSVGIPDEIRSRYWNHQIMTRKSGGVVMRVGPGPWGARKKRREKERMQCRAFIVSFSCLSSFSIFRSRSSLSSGPCLHKERASERVSGGARQFSSWSSWVINYGWDIGTSSCPFVRGT